MMSWLTRVLGRREASRPTDAEIRAVQHVTAGQDPRLNLIAEQIRRGPEVKRDRPSPNLFSLTPAYSFDDLTMYLEVEGIESVWLPIEDVLSGRTLEFRVIIGRHGFLRALEGRVRDGEPWPDRWDVAEVDPATARQVLFLPPEAEHRATVEAAKAQLEEWLTMALEPDVKLYPPPSAATLVSREQTLGGSLPPTFREFLSITDGLEFRGLRLLGHRDIYPVDSPRLSALAVAWDADDSDDFLVVVAPGGSDDRVLRLDVHLPEHELLAVADTFRDYLRSELAARRLPTSR